MPPARTSERIPGRWRRRAGWALVGLGAGTCLLFVISAMWWMGYCSDTWLADLGDGTLYTDASASWDAPLTGWCGGTNTSWLPGGSVRSWNWTWWTWGPRKEYPGQPGHAYTVWPLGPLALISGLVLAWPGHRASRRLRANRCVGCGYSRAGLDATALCPECGRAQPVTSSTRA